MVESREAEKMVDSGLEMAKEVIGAVWERYVMIGSISPELGLGCKLIVCGTAKT